MSIRSIAASILEKERTSYIFLIIMLSIMLAPIVFTALTSFKTREETFQWPPTYIPHTPT
ncbi:hypothetical protein GF339_00950, partial [candidate division KSB3 bacterium]|nr:hypothetical protein [candidate division KSB3 bacterium]MBD3323117.1 hypothetical protein [candidate division KSB3 bacterium]